MNARDEAGPAPDDTQAADDKTLRLSSIDVAPAEVDAFLHYQRALRDELDFSPVCAAGWTEHLAEAHRRALEESGLEVARHARLSPMALDFSGRRMGVKRLRRRLGEIEERIARIRERGEGVLDEELEQVGKLTAELERLDTLAPLERRHGARAIAVLREREDELVALHEQLSPLLARP
jgi:hypothetical protein